MLDSIKLEELIQVNMQHGLSLLFFVLLLEEVNNHVDYHKTTNPTFSCLVKTSFSEKCFNYDVEWSEFWKQLTTEHTYKAAVYSIVSVEGNVNKETCFVVFKLQNRHAGIYPLYVFKGLHFQQSLMYLVTQNLEFNSRVKHQEINV